MLSYVVIFFNSSCRTQFTTTGLMQPFSFRLSFPFRFDIRAAIRRSKKEGYERDE
jgi:hypothetical protein